MPAWKVLFTVVFALTCLGLAFATFVVPMTMKPDEPRWLWVAGLFTGTVCMGALFTFFLRRASAAMR